MDDEGVACGDEMIEERGFFEVVQCAGVGDEALCACFLCVKDMFEWLVMVLVEAVEDGVRVFLRAADGKNIHAVDALVDKIGEGAGHPVVFAVGISLFAFAFVFHVVDGFFVWFIRSFVGSQKKERRIRRLRFDGGCLFVCVLGEVHVCCVDSCMNGACVDHGIYGEKIGCFSDEFVGDNRCVGAVGHGDGFFDNVSVDGVDEGGKDVEKNMIKMFIPMRMDNAWILICGECVRVFVNVYLLFEFDELEVALDRGVQAADEKAVVFACVAVEECG